jgi:hypothetical protein
MRNLWAITSYFNPARYRRRLDNYRVFRRRLGVPLVAVELAYRDVFELPDDAGDILVRLHGEAMLWQKERLLNVALQHLPDECDAVAWLDCDVVFESDHWIERSLRTLERYPLLQPFGRVHEAAPDERDGWVPPEQHVALGRSIAELLAVGAATPEILGGDMRLNHRTHSGLAWVARRDVLDAAGFYDACVMGSGNRAMVCAALGRPREAIEYLQMRAAWTRHYEDWAGRHRRAADGEIGCAEGTIVHLWHGDLANRRYLQRHVEFSRFDFDPSTDIAIDRGGCWRWNSDKREMHVHVADYFHSRREDGQ